MIYSKEYTPLVSICIPAYNSQKWIKDTVLSALNQSWSNIEIIIVDDGSTDQTLKIIKELESSNVKIIKQVNKGACAARNKALNEAQGDFIQWLDADDILAPDKIEIQLKNCNLDSDSLTLHSCSWGVFYYCTSRAKYIYTSLWQDLSNYQWLLERYNKNYMMPNHAFLVSRKITELTGRWNESVKINQDGEYFTRAIINSKKIQFHPQAKCFYRIGNLDSISIRNRKLSSISYTHNLCIDHLLEYKDNFEMRQASVAFLNKFIRGIWFLSFFNNIDSDIIDFNKRRISELGGIFNPPELTFKFRFFTLFFGRKASVMLKKILWNLIILLERKVDRLFNLLGCR